MSAMPKLSVPAAATGLALLLLSACSPSDDTAAPKAQPPTVSVAAAVEQDVRQSVEFVGQIQAIDDVQILARVSGFLETKNVADGAMVKKGELLFTIEKTSYEAAVASAEADLANTKASAALQAADLERDTDLYQKGHISKAKFDATNASKEQADANVDASQARLKTAELNLSYTKISAPFDGQISKTAFSVGDVVGPTSGPITRLVSKAPVYVNFAISEKDYLDTMQGGGKAGDMVAENVPDVHLVLPNGEKYGENGEIVFIDNAVDSRTGTISIRARFVNKNLLLVPGTFVTVVIEAAKGQKALVIPQAAIQRDQRGAFVLAVNDKNLVEQRYVELGQQVDTNFVVTKGLQQGERVITLGLQKVRPGVPVQTAPDAKPVE
ncbi:efflux RND transporter periplasmic adaptor subunit [Stappia sp.]|uniref:efflux RND transporter periplasmic adaptor subunit n=1 Tax=Stappia sp. TaxID=1870903 RepID=UPI003A993BB0